MHLVLTYVDLITVGFVLALSLSLCGAVRNGLYYLFTRFNLDEFHVLQTYSHELPNVSRRQRIVATVLDPVLSWGAMALVICAFWIVNIIQYNYLLHAMLLIMTILFGTIFPIRLWIRFYYNVTRKWFENHHWAWLFIGICLAGLSLFVYYVSFYVVLGLLFRIIMSLKTVLTTATWTFASQIYMSHVYAFMITTIFVLLYTAYDMLRFDLNENTQGEL